MPQHPKYSNSPVKNLNDLYQLLSDLEKFGLMHEELHQPIDSLMSDLYQNASTKYILLANDLPLDTDLDELDQDELDSPFIPSVGELWEHIENDEREQFIQDFRNVIGLCMFENGYMLANNTETIDRLIEMRDIEYYRMHVYLSEDTETINRFKTYERTAWFPNFVVPGREGIYEISSNSYDEPKLAGYAYWDGNKWHDSCILLKDCINQVRSKETETWRNYCWRGFVNQITDE
jgi:hypothetical protein